MDAVGVLSDRSSALTGPRLKSVKIPARNVPTYHGQLQCSAYFIIIFNKTFCKLEEIIIFFRFKLSRAT